MMVAAAEHDTAEGAVVIAAGVTEEILSETAGAVRNSLGRSQMRRRMVRFDLVCPAAQ